ncbi:DUF2726 domain-containing protein [bacterium]|nr:DUF2726 domain-containing protein [bacterium]
MKPAVLLPVAFVALVVLAVIVLLAALVARAARSKGSPPPSALPYKRRDYLLSVAERSFYEVLRSITGNDLVVFAKVRLLDLVWLPAGVQNRQGWINRVSARHIDFVLCDRSNLRPLVAVELDDSSHQREDRRVRDAFVDQVCAAAGLPILHMPAKKAYVASEVAAQAQGVLEGAQ